MPLVDVEHDPFAPLTAPVDHDPFAPSMVRVEHDPFAAGQSAYRLAQRGIDTGPAVSPAYTQPPSGPANTAFRIASMPARVAIALDQISREVFTESPIDRTTGTFRPDTIETSTNIGQMMMGGAGFRLAPRGSAGMFAGPKSATADLHMLDMAQQLAERNVPREDIWKSTGWFKGPEGKWKYEIPDNEMTAQPGLGVGVSEPLSIIQHPALGSAYPQLKNVLTNLEITPNNAGGRFNGDIEVRAPNTDMMRWITAHELQHPVQQIEGFAPGASPARYEDAARQSLAHYGITDEASIREAAIKAYERTAGEVEARNVETRLNMTPQERMAKPPWETQDVPDELQTVRRPPPKAELPAVNYRLAPVDHDPFAQ